MTSTFVNTFLSERGSEKSELFPFMLVFSSHNPSKYHIYTFFVDQLNRLQTYYHSLSFTIFILWYFFYDAHPPHLDPHLPQLATKWLIRPLRCSQCISLLYHLSPAPMHSPGCLHLLRFSYFTVLQKSPYSFLRYLAKLMRLYPFLPVWSSSFFLRIYFSLHRRQIQIFSQTERVSASDVWSHSIRPAAS